MQFTHTNVYEFSLGFGYFGVFLSHANAVATLSSSIRLSFILNDVSTSTC